ncbi:MAG TPA: hypothetical protein VGE34_01765 [Candidatus Saccharimonadales bacterium]
MSISERALKYLETRKPIEMAGDVVIIGGLALLLANGVNCFDRWSREKELRKEKEL